jgi:hypothetical protein
MQQRQPRLGDILDDYCPRERRVTNHAVVAMVGPDVKQTRCTTCDTEHEYKHAKVPRQRRKGETPAALYSQVLANGPKRVVHEAAPEPGEDEAAATAARDADAVQNAPEPIDETPERQDETEAPESDVEEGPVHRPLIRATLPRPEGTPPPTRPAPEFTIRQPGGRPNRFRPRHGGRGAQQFQGNRGNGNTGGPMRGGGMPRHGSNRPPMMSRMSNRQGPGGRKRSK